MTKTQTTNIKFLIQNNCPICGLLLRVKQGPHGVCDTLDDFFEDFILKISWTIFCATKVIFFYGFDLENFSDLTQRSFGSK